MNIYLKWAIIVGLNSLSGWFYGMQLGSASYAYILGMAMGTVTWVFIYLCLDGYFLQKGNKLASRKLTLSASLRIPTQVFMLPDMLAGQAAIVTLEVLGISGIESGDKRLLDSYLLTVLTGLYLSLTCLPIFGMLSFVDFIKKYVKEINLRKKNVSPF